MEVSGILSGRQAAQHAQSAEVLSMKGQKDVHYKHSKNKRHFFTITDRPLGTMVAFRQHLPNGDGFAPGVSRGGRFRTKSYNRRMDGQRNPILQSIISWNCLGEYVYKIRGNSKSIAQCLNNLRLGRKLTARFRARKPCAFFELLYFAKLISRRDFS